MHKVRNVVAAVDIRGLDPGQTADIHTCCHKILQLCEKYSTTPTTCAFNFFDSTVCPSESRLRTAAALGNSAPYARFTSPDQMYDDLAFALDDLSLDHATTSHTEQSAVGAVTAVGFLSEGLLGMVDQFSWHPKAVEEDRERKTWQTEPNLLILCTPWLRWSSESLRTSKEDLVKTLVEQLKGVGKTLISHGIHLCWINVEQLSWNSSDESRTSAAGEAKLSELASQQLATRCRFAELGWSFWNLEFLMSSSASLPFSLAWPSVAFPAVRLPCRETFTSADVTLEVEDCGITKVETLCHVELYDLTFLQPSARRSSKKKRCFSSSKNKRIPGAGAASITVTKVLPKHTARPDLLSECDTFLLWTCSRTGSLEDGIYYGHPHAHIFELLQQDQCECNLSRPAWQIFLLQLARARMAAVVHLTQYGSTYAAVLEPLTVHCATLSIVTSKESSLLASISSSPKLSRLSPRFAPSGSVLEQPRCQLETAVSAENLAIDKRDTAQELNGVEGQEQTMCNEAERNGDFAWESASLSSPLVGQAITQQTELSSQNNEWENPLPTETVALQSDISDATKQGENAELEDLGGVWKEDEVPVMQADVRDGSAEAGNLLTTGGQTYDELMILVEDALQYVDAGDAQPKVPEFDVPGKNGSSAEKENEQAESDLEVLQRGLSAAVLEAVEQQTGHLDVDGVATIGTSRYCSSAQARGPGRLTQPLVEKATWQRTGVLPHPEVLNAQMASDDSVTRLCSYIIGSVGIQDWCSVRRK